MFFFNKKIKIEIRFDSAHDLIPYCIKEIANDAPNAVVFLMTFKMNLLGAVIDCAYDHDNFLTDCLNHKIFNSYLYHLLETDISQLMDLLSPCLTDDQNEKLEAKLTNLKKIPDSTFKFIAYEFYLVQGKQKEANKFNMVSQGPKP